MECAQDLRPWWHNFRQLEQETCESRELFQAEEVDAYFKDIVKAQAGGKDLEN